MFLFIIELNDPNSDEYKELVSIVEDSHMMVFCDGTYPDCTFEVTGFQEDDSNMTSSTNNELIFGGFEIIRANFFKIYLILLN